MRRASWCSASIPGRVTLAGDLPVFRRISGSRESATVHPIRPDDALGPLGVHDRPHTSTPVVSRWPLRSAQPITDIQSTISSTRNRDRLAASFTSV